MVEACCVCARGDVFSWSDEGVAAEAVVLMEEQW